MSDENKQEGTVDDLLDEMIDEEEVNQEEEIIAPKPEPTPEPVNVQKELDNLDKAPSTAKSNVLGFGNKVRNDKPEELPEVKPSSKIKVYFSKYKGYKIGIIPSMTKYEYIEGVKRKVSVKGHQIRFNNGRYTVQPLPGEADEDFLKRKIVEEDFLDNFMKQYPDRVFNIDPVESKLLEEYRSLKKRHEAVERGEVLSQRKGKQGPAGNR